MTPLSSPLPPPSFPPPPPPSCSSTLSCSVQCMMSFCSLTAYYIIHNITLFSDVLKCSLYSYSSYFVFLTISYCSHSLTLWCSLLYLFSVFFFDCLPLFFYLLFSNYYFFLLYTFIYGLLARTKHEFSD